MKFSLVFAFISLSFLSTAAQRWPSPTPEMKPWVYNWWMGNAVNEKGLEYQCAELRAKGFGGFHVIPIYGAKGYEKQWKTYLSSEWIEAWNLAARTARKYGLGIDLSMGAGWCFGGPWVTKELAASSGQKVKRAGIGGTGYMIDPFSTAAMSNHVSQFETAFGKHGTAERPRAFYHDSYEYYRARPKPGQDVDEAQLACFRVWTDWCRDNGYLTRNEAHGAPSNWLDFYAIADIPETEMFGKECRDILISKFASSVAHLKGTRLVSAESCTWIDEHFCERPEEIKCFLDLLFLAGVNHVFYQGLCYSPVDVQWPGWCFYASLEMNPRNPIWVRVDAISAYVTRCQSLFQTWTPDNDLAIVWDPEPFRRRVGDRCTKMTVHETDWFYGEKVGKLAKRLYADGYCFDYVSPQQLRTMRNVIAEKYVEVVDPEKDELPLKARCHPFGRTLRVTRWKTPEDETAYFIVNPSKQSLQISAETSFVTMRPLDGEIKTTSQVVLCPGHSTFVIGARKYRVCEFTEPTLAVVAPVFSTWRVTPVCGGPQMPAPHSLAATNGLLLGWETWDEAFSGTMRYSATFKLPPSTSNLTPSTLSLGDVREIAHVKLNGIDLGVAFMRPYEFKIPNGVLKPAGNELVVEVTNLGANRIRWNDRNGVRWKYFTDINMVSKDYKPFDAKDWPVRVSGLLGSVVLRLSY